MFVPQINDNLKHQTLTSQANTPSKQLDHSSSDERDLEDCYH